MTILLFFSFSMCCALRRPALCVVAQDDGPVLVGCLVFFFGFLCGLVLWFFFLFVCLVWFFFALAVLVGFDNYER